MNGRDGPRGWGAVSKFAELTHSDDDGDFAAGVLAFSLRHAETH